ncbi:hypothetical protein Pfo_025451 [Paulownia fortunei]|nr:hypothetical protein Pfo_025451 [Paulownia fortunei]
MAIIQIPFQPPKTVPLNLFRSCGACYGLVWQISSLEKVAVGLFWLFHLKGLFDPLYDWKKDHEWINRSGDIWKHDRDADLSVIHVKKNLRHEKRRHRHDLLKRRTTQSEHRHIH